jgi:hypothetical protein
MEDMMHIKSAIGASNLKHIERLGQVLLAGLLTVALGVGVQAVFAPALPADTPATGNRSDTVAAALVTAQQHQEELKDQWLERRSPSGYLFIALTTERAEEHLWLNQRNAEYAARLRQDDLKEQWLARRGVTASTAATENNVDPGAHHSIPTDSAPFMVYHFDAHTARCMAIYGAMTPSGPVIEESTVLSSSAPCETNAVAPSSARPRDDVLSVEWLEQYRQSNPNASRVGNRATQPTLDNNIGFIE